MIFPSNQEQWRDVAGYEGLYQVSSLGRVRRGGKIRKHRIDHGGYCVLSLFKHSEGKNYKVHRLVAAAFIPNPEAKRTVNHKDGNKQNNNVDNLEWATHSENIIHANRIGLRKVSDAQRRAASITGKRTCVFNRRRSAVFCIKDGTRLEFESAHAGARYVAGDASPIIRCCKGKMKTYKGYEWGYCNADQFAQQRRKV